MSTETVEPIRVRFEGPFSWTGEGLPSVADCALASSKGLYLWAVQTNVGELVHYAGQTGNCLRVRFAQHLRNQRGGQYRIYDPVALREGRKVSLWTGLFGPNRGRAALFLLANYAAPLQQYFDMARVYVAALELPPRERCRIEAAIAEHIRTQPDPVGAFFDVGVHYTPRWLSEIPFEARLSIPSTLRGFPESVIA